MEHVSQSATAESAMTEVALALAMGFFAIMVLTMMSMGAGQTERADRAQAIETAALLPNTTDAPTAAATVPGPEDQIILYYQGRFFDPELTPVTIDALAPEGRVILAVPPDLPLSEAMALRRRFDRDNLVVSTLDDRWIKALGQAVPAMLQKENSR